MKGGAAEALAKAFRENGLKEDPSVGSDASTAKPADPAARSSEAPAEPSGKNAGGEPPFQTNADGQVILTYRGRSIAVDPEQVVGLAQKGYAFESKMERLKERERELDVQGTQFQNFQAYQKLLLEKPELAERVGKMVQRAQQNLPLDDHVEGEPDEGGAAPVAASPEFQRELAELRGRVDEHDKRAEASAEERYSQEVANRVLEAYEKHPVLRAASQLHQKKGLVDIPTQRLTEAFVSDPDADPDAIAASLATEYQALIGAVVEDPNQESGDDESNFRSENPSAAPVAPASRKAPSFGAGDLRSGAIGKAAIAHLRGSRA